MNKQQLEMTLNARQAEFALLSEKLAFLRKQSVLATDANQKFSLDFQIREESAKLDQLKVELERLEAGLAAAANAPAPAAPQARDSAAGNVEKRNPTGASLRRFMGAVLRSTTDLDTFCLDRYPKVMSRFSSGMGRVERENLLFQHIDRLDILSKLAADYPDEYAANKHRLSYED